MWTLNSEHDITFNDVNNATTMISQLKLDDVNLSALRLVRRSAR